MELYVAGDLQKVLLGKVTGESLDEISLDQWAYGLGGGARLVDGKPSVGEMLVFEHEAYIYTPEVAWSEKKVLPVAFLMGVKRKPKRKVQVGSYPSVDKLYQTLLEEWPKGCVVVGECHFAKLAGAYLKVSPIHSEKVNEHLEKYWGSEESPDCSAKLFGVVLPKVDSRIFYDNPNERGKSLCHAHTHVLLDGEARHLLTYSSIESGTLWVEEISSIR